jgi:hypothetical protein
VQQLECINSGTTSLVECLQALQAEAAQAGIRVLVPGLWEEAGMEVLTAAVATAVVVRAAGVASREAEIWAVTAAGAVLAAVSDS